MKKVFALLMSVLMLAAVLGGCSAPAAGDAAPAADAELPSYNFNLGTMFYDPAASTVFNTDGELAKRFADLVSERSNGRITITVHWASVLGGTKDLFDMVSAGDLDFMAGGAITANDARFGVYSVPGLIDDFDMALDTMYNQDGGHFKMMHEIYADCNVELLSANLGQFRGIFNNTREVHLPADCNGLMMRAYADEIVTTYWGGICNTTVMAISEVYTGLQLGTIDGLEFCPPAMIANGYTDVLDYYTDINWQWQANANLIMNQNLFASLAASDQELIRQAAIDACGYYNDLFLSNLAESDTYMSENGIQVYHLTDEERAAWVEYGATMSDKYREIVGAETYDRAIAISEEYRANKG